MCASAGGTPWGSIVAVVGQMETHASAHIMWSTVEGVLIRRTRISFLLCIPAVCIFSSKSLFNFYLNLVSHPVSVFIFTANKYWNLTPSTTSPSPSPPLPPSAEIGDFDETQSWQHLLHNKYLPDQDAIRDKITECHRKHVWVITRMSTRVLLYVQADMGTGRR